MSSFNVISAQIDILVEPPYGPLFVVTYRSFLGLVKASGHEKSLVTTAFSSYKANSFSFRYVVAFALVSSLRLVKLQCQQDVKGRCKWTNEYFTPTLSFHLAWASDHRAPGSRRELQM